MFGWLQDLIKAITSVIESGLSNIGEQITNSIWGTMMTWVYETVYGAIADFLSLMGDMGADIFELKWVQSIIYLFNLFGWALYAVGIVVAIFDFAIEYQNGRGNIRT